MSEANNNATSFDSQSSSEFFPVANNNHIEPQDKVKDVVSKPVEGDAYLASDNSSKIVPLAEASNQNQEHDESSVQNMNWQKVAHKLREYNRKLLKKVFRLEQELTEIDNQFNECVEKSRNSDLLVAQQAEEIRKSQEKIALLNQQIASSQNQVQTQEAIITNLSQKFELSQKQTAHLERECALLQETYNQKTYELANKGKEIKELHNKLSQQQRYALQYKADLQRHLEKVATSDEETVLRSRHHAISNRSIKSWSASTSETKISLPQTQPQSTHIKRRIVVQASETVKTAAEIATWSTTSASSSSEVSQPVAKSARSKKPQSLAAVDLPTFPRPS